MSASTANTGSRRPRVLVVVAVGLVLGSLVRGLLLETSVVPTVTSIPTLAPGDRVLVLKTDRRAEAGDVVLVDSGDGTTRLVPGAEATGEVVGTVVWRWWPLDRVGTVASSGSTS